MTELLFPSRRALTLAAALVFVVGCESAMSGGPMMTPRDGATPMLDAGTGPDASTVDVDGGTTEACLGAPARMGRALALDGADDHVTMGAAPSLGLATFTVEAWVRRDGRGVEAGTGVGGIAVVPIAGKGRGESDGSNVDCNYAFGFVGDVLGADFEDMASGANHPVIGRTPIARGEWHHVAVTFDAGWRLYVDGALDVELAVAATPRADSIQHFAIGTALDSMGRAAGRFEGLIDEVRVWDRARTGEEIAASMGATIESAAGLVGRWSFDEGDARDDGGMNDGTIVGATVVASELALDRGAAPFVTRAAPDADEEIDAASAALTLDLFDAEGDALAVRFFLREITEADDFTIAVLPDTQYYTVQGNGWEDHFYRQTRWVMDNREAYGIAAVIHNGDIVDHGDRLRYEWTVANRAMTTLEAALPSAADGLPYGVAVGNHDQATNGATGSTTLFNEFFGVPRFAGRAYYGGHYGATNDESWFTFSAGGLDFVVVSLQYDTTPDPAILAWARRIFESHPDAFGILNSHYILTGGGAFSAQGRAIYDALRDVTNVHLMTCGHVSAESRRSDTFEGHTIHSMLADYQGRAEGGGGSMRIWEFSPANGELTVRTYSPSSDMWETDANSEFTLPVDLRGAGGEFREVGAVDPARGRASVTIDRLDAGRVYEWYAEITDCAHDVRTRVSRFTTRR